MANIGRCNRCRAKVRWCETTRGKPIPLDAEPSEAGTFMVLATRGDVARYAQGEGKPGQVKRLPDDVLLAVRSNESPPALYKPHIATCPKQRRKR